jgi:hypothetical protein
MARTRRRAGHGRGLRPDLRCGGSQTRRSELRCGARRGLARSAAPAPRDRPAPDRLPADELLAVVEQGLGALGLRLRRPRTPGRRGRTHQRGDGPSRERRARCGGRRARWRSIRGHGDGPRALDMPSLDVDGTSQIPVVVSGLLCTLSTASFDGPRTGRRLPLCGSATPS